jgi:hypothetical protein
VPVFPTKIISGGQTGADRAGLDFAICNGIPHGGWCPRGRRADGELIPAVYQLRETGSDGYRDRTLRNIAGADATLIFNSKPGRSLSPGCALTLQGCVSQQKPYLLIRDCCGSHSQQAGRLVAQFLAEYMPAVLNIAGNRESSCPGIYQAVRDVLTHAWAILPTVGQTVVAPKERQLGLKL